MIKIDLAKCTGCRRCESACTFFHTGRINSHLARIKVLNIYELGVDGPVLCIQCAERYCLRCPEKALSVGAHGQVVASPTACNLCGACELNCPIGAIEVVEDIVHVCDLCGGDPKCVLACTEQAITWNRNPDQSLAALKPTSRGRNPSERRHAYLLSQASKLRQNWGKNHGQG